MTIRRFLAFFLGVMIAAATLASAVAQERAPSPREIAAIRDCATKNKDDIDAAERECLFKLVGDPCIAALATPSDHAMADCQRIEGAIWDRMLNDNYKALLASLNGEQSVKAREMQKAWIGYRDTSCGFYGVKIDGTMAIGLHSSCITRETARRALLLAFFREL